LQKRKDFTGQGQLTESSNSINLIIRSTKRDKTKMKLSPLRHRNNKVRIRSVLGYARNDKGNQAERQPSRTDRSIRWVILKSRWSSQKNPFTQNGSIY